MATRKTLARILSSSSSLSQTLILPPRSPSLLRRIHSDPGAVPPRLLQRRPMFHSAVSVPLPAGPFPALPVGDELIDRIRATTRRDRIRLDGLAPPQEDDAAEEEEAIAIAAAAAAAAARKAARAAEMEAARARLRGTPRSCVAYGEFARICAEVAGAERGRGLARALDDAGAVIVLGDVVFLRPEMLAQAIESMIPSVMSLGHDDGHRNKELKELEDQKAAIDAKAEAQVWRELWAGLGLLTLQTIGFMRLTFWELSWDVMEPICFFVTSLYFMAGYAFFLRTSRDPSFEGFFHSRFAAKQKRLMRAHNFSLGRFDELSKAHRGPGSLTPAALKHSCSSSSSAAVSSSYCDCHRKSNLFS
ncbi:calcium uniporter protein 2, mitochondrial-like [Ananas comosus]|uniref:Calcium uniporter protein 2, mitochondrial-like n=1 Tax=Ananas comosus TaxID=4615 RepID=A0A6P5G8F4_ANACO|nr:calcium uniporter protein 2, mitochondrial-like [Ananas comosus]